MKRIYKDVILAIFLAVVAPLLLLNIPPKIADGNHTTETTLEQQDNVSSDQTVTLLYADGVIKEVPIQEYVLGVVLKEMPASFETEALKAQSVVARTYAMKRKNGNSKHPEASVCTDSQCCQGYCTVEDYLKQGGSYTDVSKIQNAVNDTAGKVITYQNELIDATFFSCSGGSTEDAQAVWGVDVPYLQSVGSPGEERAAHYTDTAIFPFDDFQFLIDQELKGDPTTWVENIRYTQGGGVDTITIQGVSYTGTFLRKKLGLRSTSFEIDVTDGVVVITTKGYGHRVGMSQYGADAMALQGKNYQEILRHYYTDTEIATYIGSD